MRARLLTTLYTAHLIKEMDFRTMMSIAVKDTVIHQYSTLIKKRNWEERRSDNNTENVKHDPKRIKLAGERIKRRKYAMLLSYSGVEYYGMQRNPSMKTIEEDLLKALLKVKLITEEAFSQIQTIQFQRAARTDKGVSAARQVVSLKLPEEFDIGLINNELPSAIRVFSIKRVTKGFNSKSNCDARTYIYMLPTIAFSSYNDDEKVDLESFRISEDIVNHVNEVLKLFVGTKNFHNFTSRKYFNDPSAMRYIISFEIGEPFIRKNVEFAIIKVKGQSFMLHQIRKMVGLTIAIVRGHTGTDTITKSYTKDRLDLPMAPGLGLVLEQVHYERYNARYGIDHDTLDWLDVEAEVNEFKENHIYPTIIDAEIDEKSMINWLQTLPKHSFDVRPDEVPENSDNKNDNSNPDSNEKESDSDDEKEENDEVK